ncbi:MAG: hypothetical protein GX196_00845 [Clostridiaceae bacterium]|nr:hypothetical protein [Clostridiaceae bacterium]
MFVYEKILQYPVKIKTPNAKLAKYILSQYGGPNGKWLILHIFYYFKRRISTLFCPCILFCFLVILK